MLKRISILFLAVFLFNCDSSIQTNEPEPLKELIISDEFFPLSIGNYWVYEEIDVLKDSLLGISTFAITDTEEIDGEIWYKLEEQNTNSYHSIYLYDRYLTVKNDSVYELQYTWGGMVPSLEYLIPEDSSQQFHSLFGGDVQATKTVYALDTAFVTKLGSFKNCYLYTLHIGEGEIHEVISYGVGLIEKQNFLYSISTGELIGHSLVRLVDYDIDTTKHP